MPRDYDWLAHDIRDFRLFDSWVLLVLNVGNSKPIINGNGPFSPAVDGLKSGSSQGWLATWTNQLQPSGHARMQVQVPGKR
jgi:hypothetical protein